MKKYYTEAEVEVIKNKLSEKIAIGVILSSLMTIVWAFIITAPEIREPLAYLGLGGVVGLVVEMFIITSLIVSLVPTSNEETIP